MAPIVIKVGGNDLEKPGFVEGLAQAVAGLQQHTSCVLVHGGGRAINRLQERLGLEPVYINGQRVTDEAALEVVEMTLSGRINKQLTLALLRAGVDALGMSGVDRGLIQVEPWSADMGRVGRIVQVRADVLHDLCTQGVVPVISPISMGFDGSYNVNADHAAGAVAAALNAAHITFLTNVPGVQVGADVAAHLSLAQARDLIAQGIINGGMIPKVNAALDAVAGGVSKAIITDLAGLSAGTGTIFAA
ncbi:MAG: acetylglutamate kinase [Anaerolineae bacterium]|nr:acetylglutamate kinase [Anaerolineae bacterium]